MSDVEIALSHCGRPMASKGSRHGWRGEAELSTWRFACEVCGASASVTTEIPVGPVGAA